MTPSAQLLIVILALLGWVGTCRLVRGEVLSLKEHEYVLAAQAVGVSNRRLLVQHILPNVLPIVIVTMTIIAGNLILVESGLSFWASVCRHPPPPGATCSPMPALISTLAPIWSSGRGVDHGDGARFYLVGDGLRDALDPRSSWRLVK
ncbi:MAG: ABC transporter permease subunit [Caldilineaceae bacterium]